MKEGIKTTEFYVALLPFALVFIKQMFGVEFEQDQIVNLIMSISGVVTGAIYVWSRFQLKMQQKKGQK